MSNFTCFIKRNYKNLIALHFLVFALFICQANEIQISLGHQNQGDALNSIKVAKGDPIRLTISFLLDDQTSSSDLPRINASQIPGLKNFNVCIGATDNAGQERNGIKINFFIEPIYEGKFKIGPVKCSIGDEIVESNWVEINVVKGTTGLKDFFATVTYDEKRYFLGQRIPLSIKLYLNKNSHDSLASLQIVKPDLHDIEISDAPEQPKESEEDLDGKYYRVIEKKYLLYPLKSGSLEILPFKIVYEISKSAAPNVFGFASIFLRELVSGSVYTNDGIPLSIDVEKVPENVHAVGPFYKIELKADRLKASVGQPIVLRFGISGSGDSEKILHPELVLPEQLRVYESKTENLKVSKAEAKDGIDFKKFFEYIVQAPKPGVYKIPPQEFVYFDTATEKVVTLQTEPLSFTVISDESEKNNQELQEFGTSKNIQSNDTDSPSEEDLQEKKRAEKLSFFGIKREYEKQVCQSRQSVKFMFFLLVLLLSLIALFFREILAWFLRKNNSRWAKSRAIVELSNAFKKNDLRAFYSIFIRYLSSRFSVNQELVDVDWMTNELKKIGLERARLDDFFVFFNQVAGLAFGKETRKHGSLETEALLKKSVFWIEAIDGLFIKHEAKSRQ